MDGGLEPAPPGAELAELLRVAQPFGAGELPQFIIARSCFPVRLHRIPGLGERLRIVHRDAILQKAGAGQADALMNRHGVAMRRETLDEGIGMQRNGIDH